MQALIQGQKNILSDLFGKAAIAGHSKGEREHHGLVFVYELLEVRLPIAGHTRCYSLIRRKRSVGMQRVTDLRGKSSGKGVRTGKGLDCVGMRRNILLIGLAFAGCGAARAQWQIQDSHSTADLRGIANVDGKVAWASGTNGTVLRTKDGGNVWQACAVPPEAGQLDFRGVQAFDANTAIVMSSGKGDLSRLYKTTDGCRSWKLLFTNPDNDGFWDAIRFSDTRNGFLLGDPVHNKFVLFGTYDGGEHWTRVNGRSLEIGNSKLSVFAASNSALLFSAQEPVPAFVTGGPTGAFLFGGLYQEHGHGEGGPALCGPSVDKIPLTKCLASLLEFQVLKIAMDAENETSGAFSIASAGLREYRAVVVGGDYKQPEKGSAAYLDRKFEGFPPAENPPHGYRSAVAYHDAMKAWITVGPNGTDVSTDDGRNWRAVRPDPAMHEAPDADRSWNALSLPFVVGPKGRIGKLDRTHF